MILKLSLFVLWVLLLEFEILSKTAAAYSQPLSIVFEGNWTEYVRFFRTIFYETLVSKSCKNYYPLISGLNTTSASIRKTVKKEKPNTIKSMFEKKTKSKTSTAAIIKSSKIGKKTSKKVQTNTIQSMFEKQKRRPAHGIPAVDIDPSKIESLSFSEITCHFCSDKILFCQIDPHYEHCPFFKQLSKLKK